MKQTTERKIGVDIIVKDGKEQIILISSPNNFEDSPLTMIFDGLISNHIVFRVKGKLVSVPNCKQTWGLMKTWAEEGLAILCERKMNDGSVEKFGWVGSESYNYRFGNKQGLVGI